MDNPIPPVIEPLPLPPPPPSEKKHFIILGCLGVALGLFLAFARAWAWAYGVMTAEAWGFVLGMALVPALIAYVIAGRKSVRNFNRFGIWFSGLSLFFFLFMGGRPESLQQHVGNLMKEAAGTKAVDNSGPGVFDNLVRDMSRDVLDDRKTLDRETQPYSAEVSRLYTLDTFSSLAAMQKSIDATRGMAAADDRYSKRLEGFPDRMQALVNQTELSESDKRDFIAGVRKGYGDMKALDIRRQVGEAEKQWAAATVDLYEFAITNASALRVAGGHVVIRTEQVRSGFNDRLEKAKKLRHDMITLNHQFEAAQNAVRQEAGIGAKDLGLEESAPDKK
jgi:hypothetical protein